MYGPFIGLSKRQYVYYQSWIRLYRNLRVLAFHYDASTTSCPSRLDKGMLEWRGYAVLRSSKRHKIMPFHFWCQLKASANTSRLVHEWRKLNHTIRSYFQKCDPIPQKSTFAFESRYLSITGRNFLFHHCTLIRNAVMDTPEYTSHTISDQSLGTFSRLNDPWIWD